MFRTVLLWLCLGVTLSTLLGRKGSLEKMKEYWDVGFYLGANILANEHRKVIEASEKLYRLKAPIWWGWSISTWLVVIMDWFIWLKQSEPGLLFHIHSMWNNEFIVFLSGMWHPSWRRSSCTAKLSRCLRWNLLNRTLWTSGWSCSCRPVNPLSLQTAAQ